MVDQVAVAVGLVGLDEREVAGESELQEVLAAVKLPHLLPLLDHRAHTYRRVEAGDAALGRPDALAEGTLAQELQFHLSAHHPLLEGRQDAGGRRREGEDALLHLAALHEQAGVVPVRRHPQDHGHAGPQDVQKLLAPAARVADDGQVLDPFAAHGGDEIAGALRRAAEAADEDGRAVGHVGHGLVEAAHDLVYHRLRPPIGILPVG